MMNLIGGIYILCFVLTRVFVIQADVPEGTPCYTPKQEYGICISIKQCEVLLNLVITQGSDPIVRKYLIGSQCGYIGQTPMVCCPQSITKSNFGSSTDAEINDFVNNTTSGYSEPVTSPRSSETYSNNLLSPPNCGLETVRGYRLVGGQPAKLHEFPWIVALGYRNSRNANTPKWLCGGTLITKRHILTAAHCVHNRPDLYLGRVGELDLYSEADGATPEDILIVRKKIHENYSPTQFTNDIAILTLEREPTVDFVWPICLPHVKKLRTKNFIGTRPVAAGWGALYFDGPSSAHLQFADIPVVDNAKCNEKFGSKAIIDNRILCAGWFSGKKDTCHGDSGGPLMYPTEEVNGDIYYWQLGIVSYGFRCAQKDYPGVYTRVTSFLDWIGANVV